MPFEIAPKEVEVKIGKFQDVADAILRGCQMHPMGVNALCRDGMTCAQGAAFFGAGITLQNGVGNFAAWATPFGERMSDAAAAYYARYNSSIPQDNNSRRLTREQIATRVAAL